MKINLINLFNDNTNILLDNCKFENEECIKYINKYYIAWYKLLSDKKNAKINYIQKNDIKQFYLLLLNSLIINQIESKQFQREK